MSSRPFINNMFAKPLHLPVLLISPESYELSCDLAHYFFKDQFNRMYESSTSGLFAAISNQRGTMGGVVAPAAAGDMLAIVTDPAFLAASNRNITKTETVGGIDSLVSFDHLLKFNSESPSPLDSCSTAKPSASEELDVRVSDHSDSLSSSSSTCSHLDSSEYYPSGPPSTPVSSHHRYDDGSEDDNPEDEELVSEEEDESESEQVEPKPVKSKPSKKKIVCEKCGTEYSRVDALRRHIAIGNQKYGGRCRSKRGRLSELDLKKLAKKKSRRRGSKRSPK
jgi:hypothetical protein